MRVITGSGSGDERSDVEARLLKLAAQCARDGAEGDLLHVATRGLASILDVGCIAVTISPSDGTLALAAQSDPDETFATAIDARRAALAEDALVAAAVMSATWAMQHEAEEPRSALLALHPEQGSFSTSAAVPISSDEGTLGAFLLYALREKAFTARLLDAVHQVASIVASMLERRKHEASVDAAERDAHRLLERIADLNADLSERAVTDKTASFCMQATGARSAVVWRLDGNRFVVRSVFGDRAIESYAKGLVANADANMPIGQGPLGRAARSGDVIAIKDALADRSFAPWAESAERSGVRTLLTLPLLADARATLVMELYAEGVDAFSERSIESVRAFIPHAQVALRNALDADGLRLLARDRALAISAASSISRSLDEAEVVRSIARSAVESLGALFALAYVGNASALSVAGGWNNPAELSAKLAVNAADPAYASYPPVQAVREGRAVVRTNIVNDSTWIRLGWEQLARAHGFNTVAGFPLLADEKAVGAVALFFATSAPSLDVDEPIVRQLGAAGGAAIEAARTYERARSARNFLDRILEESNDAIVQFDIRGSVVSWNKGAERIFGLTRPQALGQLFFELPIIPPDRREDIRELLSRVGRGEQVHVFEVECRQADGSRLEVLLSASPARDHEGKIVGLVAFSKDISEQKKQTEQLQRQNRNLMAMRDVIRSLSREVGFGAISNKGLEKLLEVLNVDVGRLYVYDAADGTLQNVSQRGFLPEGTDPVSVRADGSGAEGPLTAAVAYRQTMLTSDGAEINLERPFLAHRSVDDVTSVLTKPLTIGDDIIGAVQVIAFDARRFSSDDQSIFHAVADELAVALRQARMLEESARMAITDPLTGLYNYRFTQDVLRKRLSEARRRKRPLSIVMVDIDGLQGFNERHGREFGDVVLRQFGSILLASLRISDVVARYGGDEFIVLLPETQLSDAVMLAERMVMRIAEADWPTKDGDLTITASLGVASYPEAGTQMQMLLKAADTAVYRAKQAGRNTVFPKLDTLPRFAG